MIHVNILSMYKHVQGRTPFLPPLTSSRVCFLNSFQYIQNPVWFNFQCQDLILFKKYHDLPSTTSCESAAVVFVRNSPEYPTPVHVHKVKVTAPPIKNRKFRTRGFRFEVRKIPLRFKLQIVLLV